MTRLSAGTAPIRRIALRRVWLVGPLAGVIAAMFNIVVYLAVSALGLLPPTLLVPGQEQPITLTAVLMASFIASLLAMVVLALLVRFNRRPIRVFWIVGVVFLLLSFAGPLTIPGITGLAILALLVMHVVAGLTILIMLTTWTREQAGAPMRAVQ